MEKSANELKKRLKDKNDLGNLNTEDKENLSKYGVDEVNDWLEKNPNASSEDTEKKKKEFDDKTNEKVSKNRRKEKINW